MKTSYLSLTVCTYCFNCRPQQYILWKKSFGGSSGFYPNPISSSSTIRLACTGKFSVPLYDLTGRKISDKFYSFNQKGVLHLQSNHEWEDYVLNINSNSLISGMYFYEVISDEGALSAGKIIVE